MLFWGEGLVKLRQFALVPEVLGYGRGSPVLKYIFSVPK